MDLGAVIGAFLMLVFMVVSGSAASGPMAFFSLHAFIVVFGCTFAYMLIKYPAGSVFSSFKVIMKVFFYKAEHPNETIATLINLAEVARKESILALEKVEIENEFMRKGIRMAVDGKDPETIKSILNIEVESLENRHNEVVSVLEGGAGSAPSFGMVGTLVGMVVMFGSLEDPSTLGPAMAVSLLATLYGAVVAYVLLEPLAGKLRLRTEEEVLNMKIVSGGVLSILAGENPRVIKEKLDSYLPPQMRTAEEEPVK
jgi:chemotaxis protein MotA